MRSATARLGRITARLAAALALLALLAGVPAFLTFAFGWPLPTTVATSWDGWEQVLTAPIPDTAILSLLAIAGWLQWAGFARAVWVEARDAWRGGHTTYRLSRFHPLRALASVLIVSIAAGGIATGAAARPTAAIAASPAELVVAAAPASSLTAVALPMAQPSPALDRAPGHLAPLLPAGPAVLRIDGCSHLHTVVRGESLWAIAETCLGEGRRWPEIWQLNEGKFWPAVSGYKRFDDPDLIYPRWRLQLPAGAVGPTGSPRVEPADPAPPAPPQAGRCARRPGHIQPRDDHPNHRPQHRHTSAHHDTCARCRATDRRGPGTGHLHGHHAVTVADNRFAVTHA